MVSKHLQAGANWRPEPINPDEQILINVADKAIEMAVAAGATAAEVSLGNGAGLSVTVRQGEVETIEYNRDKSLGISVYFGHRSGSANTTDYGDEALQRCVDAASNIARFTEEDEFGGLADVDKLATEFPDLDLYHPWEVEMEQAIDIATRCEQTALEYDKAISNTEGGSLSSHYGSDVYANSLGFCGISRSSHHSISSSVLVGSGDRMQRDYWYDSCRHRDDLMSPEVVGRETARRALRRLDARKMQTGNFPVIYEAPVAASLFSHFTSAINGAALYRKASFLLDSKGAQIFPENIRIHEQPLLPRASGSAAFDKEGVATRTHDLVRDGILMDYVLGSYSARKLGLETTGNAGGVHNLTIDSTTDGNLADMISDMGTGLVVSELIGHGVNNVTGDYSRGAFGFWVENGEIQYPVQELTIAGNLRDMFRAIAAVGADVDARRGTRTGSVLISNMTIAGE